MLAKDDYLYYVDRALDGMVAIVSELGDDFANEQAYRGANTPFALLHHCLAVVETWIGGFVTGRPIDRDRDSEFHARGPVAPLVARVAAIRTQLHTDVAAADTGAALRREPPAEFLGPPKKLTQGAALQHVFEELAQHHGQMETLRDVLVQAPARLES